MNNNTGYWRMVILLCATATAGYICRVNISTAAPLLMQEFGMSQVAMGRVFSAFLLGYALFQVPAGALADKYGVRTVLGLAAWLWAALTLLQCGIGWGAFALSSGSALILFMMARFITGITASPTYPASANGVARWVPPAFQARANGIVIASVGLGSALAPPLVSNIMVRWGWRPAILVTAFPAIVIALIWRTIKEPRKPLPENNTATGRSNNSDSPSAKTFWSKDFILLTVSYTLQGYVGYIFVAWFYLYLVQERHFGLLEGGWVSALPWILSIISMPLGGWIADRLQSAKKESVWSGRIVPITGMAMSGILISIGAHTNSAIIAAITLAFATAFILCVEGPFWGTMIRFAGKDSGKAGGFMNMGSNLGGLLSPTLTPIIASKIGWENALHVAAVLSIIGALLWCRIGKEKVVSDKF